MIASSVLFLCYTVMLSYSIFFLKNYSYLDLRVLQKNVIESAQVSLLDILLASFNSTKYFLPYFNNQARSVSINQFVAQSRSSFRATKSCPTEYITMSNQPFFLLNHLLTTRKFHTAHQRSWSTCTADHLHVKRIQVF